MPRGGRRPGTGGKREGAGRKRGSATRKTRAIADRAVEEGVTPLEVMLACMRRHYDAGNLDRAAEVAKDCAPFMHPRLASVPAKGEVSVEVHRVITECRIEPHSRVEPATQESTNGHAKAT
jgi:hypothetical protein